jgi:hypothetical protein
VQVEFTGLAMDVPLEADPLDAPANQKVKHHRRPVLQTCFVGRNRVLHRPRVRRPAGARYRL